MARFADGESMEMQGSGREAVCLEKRRWRLLLHLPGLAQPVPGHRTAHCKHLRKLARRGRRRRSALAGRLPVKTEADGRRITGARRSSWPESWGAFSCSDARLSTLVKNSPGLNPTNHRRIQLPLVLFDQFEDFHCLAFWGYEA